jgi:hypothetical protein
VLLAGLCTPLWFYALVFWEHSIATCLCIAAIRSFLAASRRGSAPWAAASGAALGAALWFREELLLLAGLLLVLLPLQAKEGRPRLLAAYAASLAALLVPLALFQEATVGSAFGHHVSSNLAGAERHLASRLEVFYRLFCATGPGLGASLALTAPFAAALVLRPALPPRLFRWAVPVGALYATAVALFALSPLLDSPAPIAHLLQSNSLLPAAPIAMLALFTRRTPQDPGERAGRRLSTVVLGYGLLYGLAAPLVSAKGIHWGNRYLLLLYPLLALLAARNLLAWIRDPRARRALPLAGVLTAIAVSLAAQICSLHLLRLKTDFSFRLNQALAERPEPVVVSDVWWAPQEMYSVFGEKPLFHVTEGPDLAALEGRLRAAGHDRFLFVTWERPVSRPGVLVGDGGLGAFSLLLVPVRLGAPTGAPRAAGP